MKQCSRCGETKELSAFYKSLVERGGNICKACTYKRNRKWARTHTLQMCGLCSRHVKKINKKTKLTATNNYRRWIFEETELLKDISKTDEELAVLVGRTLFSIRNKRGIMGIHK